MSNPEEKKAAKTNGAGVDMSERLASFKPPRDFTLGGSKPNRKVFTPNLNVSRNKTKGPSATGNKEQKKDERGKRERKNDRNRNLRNGANVIKSGGVFSEGLGSGQKHSSRGSYNRDSESTPSVLQRPIIRVKDVVKIDKELEEQRIKAAVARGAYDDDDDDDFKGGVDRMAPIRLPMDDGGWSTNQTKKVTVKVKEEVIVKTEPEDPTDIGTPVVETKPRVTVKKEVVDDSNLVNLLNNDQPTMLLIKFPDTLPGRGGESEDSPPQRKPKQTASTAAATSEDDDTKPVEPRCQLKHLEEGKVGKLQIHRSGRVTLALGNTTFEVSLGTRSVCHQQLVSVAADSGSRAASLVALGPLLHKLNVIPDWQHMLHDI